ncbi:MAG: hypothetical protein PV344_05350, partial [Anaplasma sp.]|nr:hypothetical protein [Anaplasma sp.]
CVCVCVCVCLCVCVCVCAVRADFARCLGSYVSVVAVFPRKSCSCSRACVFVCASTTFCVFFTT